MWAGWLNLVIGIWTLISGFIYSVQGMVNLIIVGIILAVLNFATGARSTWQGILCGIFGIWLLIAGIVGVHASVNFIIVGILTVIFGIWLGVKKTEPQQP
jgi:hypothetical protein